jgi:hypothetical protein
LKRGSAVTLLLLFAFRPAEAPCAADDHAAHAQATGADIKSLIRDLGDPRYETRTAATRRLCAIGMRAEEPLRVAARGDDTEIALRARQLLLIFEQLWFWGTGVSLAFDRSAVRWDEPAELRITLTNGSDYPSRIPFLNMTAGSDESRSDAEQVGMMLDLADMIQVRDADGRQVELHVDDTSTDPAVSRAVEHRLTAIPSGIIEPGGQVTLSAPDFNRGWARYPLLDAGVYTVELVYEPEWEDQVLASRQVGRVTSNRVSLRVTQGAPSAVSRDGVIASLSLKAEGGSIVARLTNRTDQPMLVNKNFGTAAPFAVGSWVYSMEGDLHEIPLSPVGSPGLSDFDAGLLVDVRPGGDVELARTDMRDLLRVLASRGADLDNDYWTIHFSYRSYLDRHWQRRHGRNLYGGDGVPAVLREPISRRILSGRQASNRLTAPKPE